MPKQFRYNDVDKMVQISPDDFKYRVYAYEPLENTEGEMFLYVSNGSKRKNMFDDRIIVVTKSGFGKKYKNVKIPSEDLKKIRNLININEEVLRKMWKLELFSGSDKIWEKIKWIW